jgi:hypothetical protein
MRLMACLFYSATGPSMRARVLRPVP